jgi:transposase-like protein
MARPAFPKTLIEFRELFSQEQACFEYLSQCRWPDGFVCAKCSGRDFWIKARRFQYKCQDCGCQTSATAGTMLHRTHFPLREWFWAAYLMTTHTPGMSATQLQRQLGCSYKTAWFLLHRLRRAMVNDARSALRGRVEADEVLIGGPAKDKTGRGVAQAPHVTLVFGAVEVISYTGKHGEKAEKAGRLRLAVTKNAAAVSIRRFLTANIESGGDIYTDGWKGYSKTALAGYGHELHPSGTHARHIHRAFGNLKTWLNGIHHGVEPKHLQSYLDEYIFRFNRRKTPMAAFQTLLGLATAKLPVPYEIMKLGAPTG